MYMTKSDIFPLQWKKCFPVLVLKFKITQNVVKKVKYLSFNQFCYGAIRMPTENEVASVLTSELLKTWLSGLLSWYPWRGNPVGLKVTKVSRNTVVYKQNFEYTTFEWPVVAWHLYYIKLICFLLKVERKKSFFSYMQNILY